MYIHTSTNIWECKTEYFWLLLSGSRLFQYFMPNIFVSWLSKRYTSTFPEQLCQQDPCSSTVWLCFFCRCWMVLNLCTMTRQKLNQKNNNSESLQSSSFIHPLNVALGFSSPACYPFSHVQPCSSGISGVGNCPMTWEYWTSPENYSSHLVDHENTIHGIPNGWCDVKNGMLGWCSKNGDMTNHD